MAGELPLQQAAESSNENNKMASEPIRHAANDHLLTPRNSALLIINYQPGQLNSIASMDRYW
jgi:hypothetical protein